MNRRTLSRISLSISILLVLYAVYQFLVLKSTQFIEIYLGLAAIALVYSMRLHREH